MRISDWSSVVCSSDLRNHVLSRQEAAARILDCAPHSVEVHWMRHGGIVDQRDPEALVLHEMDGFGIVELDTVQRPDEPLHVAGEMQFDLTAGRALIHGAAHRDRKSTRLNSSH